MRILYLHDNSTGGNGPTLGELLASRECDLVVSGQIPEEGANYDFILSPRSAAGHHPLISVDPASLQGTSLPRSSGTGEGSESGESEVATGRMIASTNLQLLR
ncbi:hypothetical protein N9B73_09955 [Verrucomicrobiales bacterium]|nr:hypothetical protein [Verrucomicrobiales bacterium]